MFPSLRAAMRIALAIKQVSRLRVDRSRPCALRSDSLMATRSKLAEKLQAASRSGKRSSGSSARSDTTAAALPAPDLPGAAAVPTPGSNSPSLSNSKAKKRRKSTAEPWPISPDLRQRANRIACILNDLYPDMPCPLDSSSNFQLLIAVILSSQVLAGSCALARFSKCVCACCCRCHDVLTGSCSVFACRSCAEGRSWCQALACHVSKRCVQTTDKKVNQVTPSLFALAPDAPALAQADVIQVESIIREVGLAPTKSKNIVRTAQQLVDLHNGQVPCTFEELEALPGVGHKTASVVMAHCFKCASLRCHCLCQLSQGAGKHVRANVVIASAVWISQLQHTCCMLQVAIVRVLGHEIQLRTQEHTNVALRAQLCAGAGLLASLWTHTYTAWRSGGA